MDVVSSGNKSQAQSHGRSYDYPRLRKLVDTANIVGARHLGWIDASQIHR
jgi:hypothetical protein